MLTFPYKSDHSPLTSPPYPEASAVTSAVSSVIKIVGVAAEGQLTFTGGGGSVGGGESITIGGSVISIESNPANVTTNTILINTSVIASGIIDDVSAAISVKEFINGESASVVGVSFLNRTFDEPVTASVSGAVVTVSAEAVGVGGNTIATVETLNNGSWAWGADSLMWGTDEVLYDQGKQVAVTPQGFTDGEMAQARENIEAIGEDQRGQPGGFAGLDPDGNIVASVVPLGNTWLALKDVVLAAGERAYCVDTTETFTGDGTSAIKDMWATSCDKYEVDRGSNGAAEFERVRRDLGLPQPLDEYGFQGDFRAGVRMIVSNSTAIKANNKFLIKSGTGFVRVSLYNGSMGTAQSTAPGEVNIEDAVGLVAPYGATEIVVVACDAAGVVVDVGDPDGITEQNSVSASGSDVDILAYTIGDTAAVVEVDAQGSALRLYDKSVLNYRVRGDSSSVIDCRHVMPAFSLGDPYLHIVGCFAEALWLGEGWVNPSRLYITNCQNLKEVKFFGGGPLTLYLFGTALGIDGFYDLIDGLLESDGQAIYIDFCPFATAFNGSGTQVGQTHTVADVVALAAAKNIYLQVYAD